MRITRHGIWLFVLFTAPGAVLGGLGGVAIQQGVWWVVPVLVLASFAISAYTGTWAGRREK